MTQTSFRFADLNNKDVSFELVPETDVLTEIAQALNLLDLKKLRFEGALIPSGRQDWRLSAHLGATVVQPCGLTLVPVTTRIEEDIQRTYLSKMPEITDSEIEMPEDDSVEERPEMLDLVDVMTEALSLSLPPFPRAEGVAFATQSFTEPGKTAMTDEDARPFAGLSDLKKRLEDDEK